jgi:anti-sigma B factor antagonist
MNVEMETRGSVLVARVLDSRFDAASAGDFRLRMGEVVAAGSTKIVVDLSPVRFMDSGALGSVLAVLKTLPPGGDLRLSGVHEPVRGVFRMTRLDKVVAIDDTVDDAAAALGAPAPGPERP